MSMMLPQNHKCVICAVLLALCLGSLSVAAAEEARSIPAGQRQLFLDDDAIAKIENLKRTLHQPEKRGAVIRSANPSQTIQTRTAPVWDPEAKHFKLWVMSTDEPLRISTDGLHWTAGPRPNLRIDHAVYDPHDKDPARRFKAALLNEGFAVSPDGVQWTKLDLPAIPSSDEGNFSYDPSEGLFIHSVKRGGPFGRSVAIATSWDFKTWNDYGVVFHADELDQEIGKRRIAERLANPMLKQLDAGEEPGTLLTKPFVLAGTTLHVNVDARAGELGVTVLGEDGQTVAVAEPVTGNQPRAEFRWKSGNLNSVKGKTVSLRLSLRNARLYSFWSE